MQLDYESSSAPSISFFESTKSDHRNAYLLTRINSESRLVVRFPNFRFARHPPGTPPEMPDVIFKEPITS